jgi:hypothetical protein
MFCTVYFYGHSYLLRSKIHYQNQHKMYFLTIQQINCFQPLKKVIILQFYIKQVSLDLSEEAAWFDYWLGN